MQANQLVGMPHPIHQKCWIRSHFSEAAVFTLVPLLIFSELRESDRYPKVNTPFRCDGRILVINHPLPGNIKVERW
jgi:hypothetical protein